MYKVFVENRPVLFEKNRNLEENSFSLFFPSLKTEDYSDFVRKSGNNSSITLPLSGNDIFTDSFFKHFKKIEAAGGIVHHLSSDTYLFIFRNNKWDLPKGKIEKKESPKIAAIREIQEECGITGHTITKKILDTFHTYFAFDKYWLKKTHWYYLEYDGDRSTTPQLEENITATAWKSKKQWSEIKGNTFGSIIDVLDDLIEK